MGLLDIIDRQITNSDIRTLDENDPTSKSKEPEYDNFFSRIIDGTYGSEESKKTADSTEKTAESTAKTAESTAKTAEETSKIVEETKKAAETEKAQLQELEKLNRRLEELDRKLVDAERKANAARDPGRPDSGYKPDAAERKELREIEKLDRRLASMDEKLASAEKASRDSGSPNSTAGYLKTISVYTVDIYNLLKGYAASKGGAGGGGGGDTGSTPGTEDAGADKKKSSKVSSILAAPFHAADNVAGRAINFAHDRAFDLYSNAIGYTQNPYTFLTNSIKDATSGIPIVGGFIGAGMNMMNEYMQAAIARDNATKSLLTTTGLTAGIGRSGRLSALSQEEINQYTWLNEHEGFAEAVQAQIDAEKPEEEPEGYSPYAIGRRLRAKVSNLTKRDTNTEFGENARIHKATTGAAMTKEGLGEMFDAGADAFHSTLEMLAKAFKREGVDEFAAMGITDTQAAQFASQAYQIAKGGYKNDDQLRGSTALLAAYSQNGIDAGQIGGLNQYFNSGIGTSGLQIMGAIQALKGVGVDRNPIDTSDFAKSFQQFSQAYFASAEHTRGALLDQVKMLSEIEDAAKENLNEGNSFQGQFLGQSMAQMGQFTANALSTPMGGIAYATAYNSLTNKSIDEIGGISKDLASYIKKFGVDANAVKMYQEKGSTNGAIMLDLADQIISQAGTGQAAITAMARQMFGGSTIKASQAYELLQTEAGRKAFLARYTDEDKTSTDEANSKIIGRAKGSTTDLQVTTAHGDNLKVESAIEHIEALDSAVLGLNKAIDGLKNLLSESNGLNDLIRNITDGAKAYNTSQNGQNPFSAANGAGQ